MKRQFYKKYSSRDAKGLTHCLLCDSRLEKSGAGFKRQFDIESYRAFFEKAGYKNVTYDVVRGRMPCVIAIIKK